MWGVTCFILFTGYLLRRSNNDNRNLQSTFSDSNCIRFALSFNIISHLPSPSHLTSSLIYLSHLYTPSQLIHSSADIKVFRIPPSCTKSCGQCSFSYQAPPTWKQLSVSVGHAASVRSFKPSLILIVCYQGHPISFIIIYTM